MNAFEQHVHLSPKGVVGVHLDVLPDSCGWCGERGQQIARHQGQSGESSEDITYAFFLFQCPINACRRVYAAYYETAQTPIEKFNKATSKSGLQMLPMKFIRTYPSKLRPHFFPDSIVTLSARFCAIFNQAYEAEHANLDEVSGPGYRKALEFLIKDYLIAQDLTKSEVVKKTQLGPLISNHIKNESIKQCAERATWLGNDEIHYARKWDTKDMQDLKRLIHLSMNYIDTELEAARYLTEMPTGKK